MNKLYIILAQTVQAYHACIKSNNREWKLRHAERLGALVREHMPSGAGIDSGTSFNLDKSNAEKLVFETKSAYMMAGRIIQ